MLEMIRLRVALVLIGCATAVAAAACSHIDDASGKEVRAELAEPADVSALGRLEPENGVIRIAGPSRPSAVIAQLLVEEGDRVVVGQPIAVLDSRTEDAAQVARMKANLESSGGLVFSGQLLLDLVEHGVSREDAYRKVQAHAMRAWKEGLNFHDLVLKDRDITSRVPRQQLEHAFDLKRQLRNIDKIFARVFPGSGGGARQAKTAAKKKRGK